MSDLARLKLGPDISDPVKRTASHQAPGEMNFEVGRASRPSATPYPSDGTGGHANSKKQYLATEALDQEVQ
jgi:hypothetical protein